MICCNQRCNTIEQYSTSIEYGNTIQLYTTIQQYNTIQYNTIQQYNAAIRGSVYTDDEGVYTASAAAMLHYNSVIHCTVSITDTNTVSKILYRIESYLFLAKRSTYPFLIASTPSSLSSLSSAVEISLSTAPQCSMFPIQRKRETQTKTE